MRYPEINFARRATPSPPPPPPRPSPKASHDASLSELGVTAKPPPPRPSNGSVAASHCHSRRSRRARTLCISALQRWAASASVSIRPPAPPPPLLSIPPTKLPFSAAAVCPVNVPDEAPTLQLRAAAELKPMYASCAAPAQAYSCRPPLSPPPCPTRFRR
eukprot:351002-Chlamydomonas_euryale.AAC.15